MLTILGNKYFEAVCHVIVSIPLLFHLCYVQVYVFISTFFSVIVNGGIVGFNAA
jgi:hypothetical protein